METWYCTAYPSSIAYQIEEVIPGAVAKQVRQVAALQGNVLQKTQAVMILMTVLSLLAAAVAVANLMVASIGERSSELALLKAIGATDGAVSRLMMAETAAISLLGAIVGAAIKKNLCQSVQGDRSWLHKLRPWWGHKEHFHVRIGCPADSASCLPGPAIPAGDGCGSELDWWFTDEAKVKAKAIEHSQPIPEQCRGIVRGDER